MSRPESTFALAALLCVSGGCGDNGTDAVLNAWCEREAFCEPEDSNLAECAAALTSLVASLGQVFGPSCTDSTTALLECEADAPCNDASACAELNRAANDACLDLIGDSS